jgi:hypothetical protein
MPYDLTHRHRYWFIDLRYLVRLQMQSPESLTAPSDDGTDGSESTDPLREGWVYSLCIIEGYLRKIVAGMASPYQDVVAVLQLLSAALSTYGRPEGIVSDNGSVFTSQAYEDLLTALQIEICHIEKGKPWQNLLDAQFKIERCLADAQIERADTLAKIQVRHAAFVETFNTTPHWAHRKRADGLRTPEAVLAGYGGASSLLTRWRGRCASCSSSGSQSGGLRECAALLPVRRARTRAQARLGLALRQAPRLASQQALLAQYTYHAERRGKRLRAVDPHPQLYHTAYASPQLELWELDDKQWRKVMELPPRQHHPVAAPASRMQQLADISQFATGQFGD